PYHAADHLAAHPDRPAVSYYGRLPCVRYCLCAHRRRPPPRDTGAISLYLPACVSRFRRRQRFGARLHYADRDHRPGQPAHSPAEPDARRGLGEDDMAANAPNPVMHRRSIVGEIFFWLALVIAFVFFMFPLYWMLV